MCHSLQLHNFIVQMISLLKKYQHIFHPVVPFNASTDKLLLMDFTENNQSLTEETFSDTNLFTEYINHQLKTNNALYGIGGYNELRNLYARSKVFDDASEPRRLHLGIDIWGKPATPVFAPIGGVVHSYAFNDHFGDYGATIILQHQLKAKTFHTLYGHLSFKDIEQLKEGKFINEGEIIAHFGEPNENGHWPPHLHFQIIIDMPNKSGDYPGVCKFSEREKYLANCPNADLVLQMMKYAK